MTRAERDIDREAQRQVEAESGRCRDGSIGRRSGCFKSACASSVLRCLVAVFEEMKRQKETRFSATPANAGKVRVLHRSF